MSERRRKPGSQSSLREANRARLIDAIRQHGALTQVELAGITGLSPATVSNIVKELGALGVLQATPSTHSGRRAVRVSLAHERGLVIAAHVSARQLRVGIADLAGTLLEEHHLPLARDHRADAELDRIALLSVDMLDSLDSSLDEVLAVGLAIAAPIDRATGTVVKHEILRGWGGVVIADSLSARLGRPVVVENSSDLAAIAEHRFGAARGTQSSVTLELGDGIGAGIVIDGRLLRGHTGVVGALGHVVVDPDGPVCRCGARGCLEAIAAAPAVLERLSNRRGATKVTDLVVRALSGDQESLRAIADAGRTIGLAVGGLCNVIDPERLVVVGGFASAGELLLGPMRHAIEASFLGGSRRAPELVQGQLGPQAALLGAVTSAVEHAAQSGELPRLTGSLAVG